MSGNRYVNVTWVEELGQEMMSFAWYKYFQEVGRMEFIKTIVTQIAESKEEQERGKGSSLNSFLA